MIITTTKKTITFFISSSDISKRYRVYQLSNNPLFSGPGTLLSISFVGLESRDPMSAFVSAIEVAQYSTTSPSISYEYIGCPSHEKPMIDLPLRPISPINIRSTGSCH